MSQKQQTRPKETYLINLKRQGQCFIPSDSPYLSDVNPNILHTLRSSKKYCVRSKVSIDVLQSFIDNWINQIMPDINPDNFNEYEQLSQEFDRMKSIIKISRPFKSLLKKANVNRKQYETKNFILQKLLHKYQRSIHLLFKYGHYDSTTYTFPDLKKIYFYQKNIDKIILRVMKTVEYNEAEYIIDEYERTASLVKYKSTNYQFGVPNEIEYGSEKFKVTSISNFECKKECCINFSIDSPIKKIFKSSLDCRNVKKITVPSTIEEIEDGFCINRSDIEFGIINVKNKEENVLFAANAFAIKSDPMLDYYDILLTPGKKVNYQEVSCFIKRIASYAFVNNDLETLHFRPNSTLESIGEHSFYRCKLTRISFPPSLTRIESNAFRSTPLRKIYFPPDSKLKEIESFAFGNCELVDIELPSSLVKLGYACFSFNRLKRVVFKGKSQLEEIGGDSFGCNELTSFRVPLNVKKIGKLAFSDIHEFKELELTSNKLPEVGRDIFFRKIERIIIPSDLIITEEEDIKWKKYLSLAQEIIIKQRGEENIKYIQNSQLIIGRTHSDDNFSILYFANKMIKKAKVPSFIEVISTHCFFNCEHLKCVTFEDKSNLNVIENCAFEKSSIEELSIPSGVCILEPNCFLGTNKLINIQIIQCKEQNVIYYDDSILIGKSNFDEFDTIHFVRRNLEKITIPSFVKKINLSSFDCCDKINEINFEKNSNLEKIDEFQFSKLNIARIEIPRKVASIENSAFYNCKSLKFVDFEDDSNLYSIGDNVFEGTSVCCLKIQSSVSTIGKSVFYGCCKMQIIEIGEGSKLKSISSYVLGSDDIIVMLPVELYHIVEHETH